MTDDQDELARRFETHRPRLRALARRLLGTEAAADDAVQETWLRLARADVAAIDRLEAWLTTVVTRVALDVLRGRRTHPTESLDRVPDPVVSAWTTDGPYDAVILADRVEVALRVLLDALTPAERVAFVLHDLFGVPFGEIGALVDRSPDAARQLASRARRRIRSAADVPPRVPTDADRDRAVVDAFLAATRDGDLDRLVATLAPDVVLREDFGPSAPVAVHRGAPDVAEQAALFAALARHAVPALVDGAPGLVAVRDGRVRAVLSFAVAAGRITRLDVVADRTRLGHLDALGLAGPPPGGHVPPPA